ncbi:CarD family transcriptional regulator [Clostridium tarantellae]|uniref:CarD family transcriptional regulator n=1 Tax=Clostridium tarantellae TaxID=39493 RepID=UPI001479180D|nr:CarD family transcriptional regulator [Clostridium tarantellae]
MFHVGDKIVYPNQGVGTIQYIEDKEFCGEIQKYYKIHLINNNMDVLIPAKRLEHCNLRGISDINTLNNLLSDFKHPDFDLENFISSTSKQRIIDNNEKLKVGSLKNFFEVVYDLTKLNAVKSLNLNEKQILFKAKKFLLDEISLIKNISEEEADEFLNENLIIH